MPTPATAALSARRSAIRVVFDAAQGRSDLIRLEIGEPSFTTPSHVTEAALRAALAGQTRYGPNGGLLSLRQLLVEKVGDRNRFHVEPDQVVVTPGGMNALYSSYLALLEPGDEVLLPSPGFPNMDEMVRLVGGRPVHYKLLAERAFLPDPLEIASLVTRRTRVLFINSPSNPTGAVFPGELVERLVRLADAHDLWLISDEVYDELVLDDDVEHVSAARFDREDRVVTVFSFSKVFAMTGWRVGYLTAPPPLADLIRKLQEPQLSCPSTISQVAAEAALTGPRAPFEAMRQAYAFRRGIAWDTAVACEVAAFRSQGTIYMMLDVGKANLSSMAFTTRLIDEFQVTVAPGSAFGPGNDRLIRVSLATDPELLRAGIERIGRAVEAWSGESR